MIQSHVRACSLSSLVLYTILASSTTRYAPTPDAHATPKEEVRALWVARYSIASPQAIHNVVAQAKRHNFNTLFVQVRGRGDAWYHSDLEPRAEGLRGQPESFDPLQTMLEEAHKAGLKVHAWLNTYLTWTGASPPKSRNHPLNAHKDWIARDRHGSWTTLASDQVEGAFLQPSSPEVQDHLFKVFMDVAKRYDVDGIHFDFVRYASSDYDFSDPTLKRFRNYMDPKVSDSARIGLAKNHTRFAYVHLFPKEWADWRRAQVTTLVQRISTAVHESKPWAQVSAAVFANADDAFRERGQDWKNWLAEGYLDSVCPMAYSRDTQTVAKQIQGAILAAGERHVYAGIGSWRLSAADTAIKIARIRSLGAQGVNIFSYDGITRDGRDSRYLDALARSAFPSRAGVPGMRWRATRALEEEKARKVEEDRTK